MRKTRAAKWIAIGIAVVAAVWLSMRVGQQRPAQVGDPAPPFTLPEVPQGTISLTQFRGKVVIVNFWATWCPPCVAETPSLEQFAAQVKQQGAVVIGVSVDENGEQLREFVKQFHLTYLIARDPERALAARYGTFKFPETYIIDRTGRVAEKIVGATDWSDPRMTTFVRALIGNGVLSQR